MTASTPANVRRIAPPSATRAAAPASAPPPAASTDDTWAAIQAIQNTLNGLIAQVTSPVAAADKSPAQVQNETQRKLVATLKANLQPHPILQDGPEGMWLTDLAQLAGVEKGIAHTQARKLNYRNRIGLSLEKDERIGKSAFWVTVR